jgi:hypothetical protein
MKRLSVVLGILTAVGLGGTGVTLGQGLPTNQPNMITIVREEVKVGRNAEHARHEAGWPAAYEKAKSPDYYIAMTSLTGPNEAWYVIPSESHAAWGESMKRDDKDPVLSAELERLAFRDADYINGSRTLQAIAQTELSAGDFPDVAKVRFFNMSIFKVHAGREEQFEAAAKAYAAARKRAAPKVGYRVYQVIAGMPGPTYLIISSVEDYGGFDAQMAAGMATWKELKADEKDLITKAGTEAVVSEESNRFKVDPKQSYVPKATRESDPQFWMPK